MGLWENITKLPEYSDGTWSWSDKRAMADNYVNEYLAPHTTGPEDLQQIRQAFLKENGLEYQPASTAQTLAALPVGLAHGVMYGVPEMAGQLMSYVAPETGQAISKWANKNIQESIYEQTDPWSLAGALYQGASMLAPSLAPGAIAGGVAKAAKVKNAFDVAAKAAGASYGLAEGQRAYREGEEAGLPLGANLANAAVRGTVEAVGETLGTKYLGKALGVKEAMEGGGMKAIAEKARKTTFGQGVKEFLKVLGVEEGTEVGQALGQSLSDKLSGLRPDAQPLQEAMAVIPGTAVMTALTGGAGALGRRLAKDTYPAPPPPPEPPAPGSPGFIGPPEFIGPPAPPSGPTVNLLEWDRRTPEPLQETSGQYQLPGMPPPYSPRYAATPQLPYQPGGGWGQPGLPFPEGEQMALPLESGTEAGGQMSLFDPFRPYSPDAPNTTVEAGSQQSEIGAVTPQKQLIRDARGRLVGNLRNLGTAGELGGAEPTPPNPVLQAARGHTGNILNQIYWSGVPAGTQLPLPGTQPEVKTFSEGVQGELPFATPMTARKAAQEGKLGKKLPSEKVPDYMLKGTTPEGQMGLWRKPKQGEIPQGLTETEQLEKSMAERGDISRGLLAKLKGKREADKLLGREPITATEGEQQSFWSKRWTTEGAVGTEPGLHTAAKGGALEVLRKGQLPSQVSNDASHDLIQRIVETGKLGDQPLNIFKTARAESGIVQGKERSWLVLDTGPEGTLQRRGKSGKFIYDPTTKDPLWDYGKWMERYQPEGPSKREQLYMTRYRVSRRDARSMIKNAMLDVGIGREGMSNLFEKNGQVYRKLPDGTLEALSKGELEDIKERRMGYANTEAAKVLREIEDTQKLSWGERKKAVIAIADKLSEKGSTLADKVREIAERTNLLEGEVYDTFELTRMLSKNPTAMNPQELRVAISSTELKEDEKGVIARARDIVDMFDSLSQQVLGKMFYVTEQFSSPVGANNKGIVPLAKFISEKLKGEGIPSDTKLKVIYDAAVEKFKQALPKNYALLEEGETGVSAGIATPTEEEAAELEKAGAAYRKVLEARRAARREASAERIQSMRPGSIFQAMKEVKGAQTANIEAEEGPTGKVSQIPVDAALRQATRLGVAPEQIESDVEQYMTEKEMQDLAAMGLKQVNENVQLVRRMQEILGKAISLTVEEDLGKSPEGQKVLGKFTKKHGARMIYLSNQLNKETRAAVLYHEIGHAVVDILNDLSRAGGETQTWAQEQLRLIGRKYGIWTSLISRSTSPMHQQFANDLATFMLRKEQGRGYIPSSMKKLIDFIYRIFNEIRKVLAGRNINDLFEDVAEGKIAGIAVAPTKVKATPKNQTYDELIKAEAEKGTLSKGPIPTSNEVAELGLIFNGLQGAPDGKKYPVYTDSLTQSTFILPEDSTAREMLQQLHQRWGITHPGQKAYADLRTDRKKAEASRPPIIDEIEALRVGASTVSDWVRESSAFKQTLAATDRWFTDSIEEATWYIENEYPGGRLVYMDVPAAQAEQYRVSNIPMKEGGADNPRAFSRRPDKEFFVPKGLATTRKEVTVTPAELAPPDKGYVRLYRAEARKVPEGLENTPEELAAIEKVRSRPLYHGTKSEFIAKIKKEGFKFDQGKSDPGDLGYGLYTTTDKEFAKHYAKDDSKIIPINQFPSNPLYLDFTKREGTLESPGRDKLKILQEMFGNTTYVSIKWQDRLAASKRWSEELQKMGYDGVVAKGYEGAHNYTVVFFKPGPINFTGKALPTDKLTEETKPDDMHNWLDMDEIAARAREQSEEAKKGAFDYWEDAMKNMPEEELRHMNDDTTKYFETTAENMDWLNRMTGETVKGKLAKAKDWVGDLRTNFTAESDVGAWERRLKPVHILGKRVKPVADMERAWLKGERVVGKILFNFMYDTNQDGTHTLKPFFDKKLRGHTWLGKGLRFLGLDLVPPQQKAFDWLLVQGDKDEVEWDNYDDVKAKLAQWENENNKPLSEEMTRHIYDSYRSIRKAFDDIWWWRWGKLEEVLLKPYEREAWHGILKDTLTRGGTAKDLNDKRTLTDEDKDRLKALFPDQKEYEKQLRRVEKRLDRLIGNLSPDSPASQLGEWTAIQRAKFQRRKGYIPRERDSFGKNWKIIGYDAEGDRIFTDFAGSRMQANRLIDAFKKDSNYDRVVRYDVTYKAELTPDVFEGIYEEDALNLIEQLGAELMNTEEFTEVQELAYTRAIRQMVVNEFKSRGFGRYLMRRNPKVIQGYTTEDLQEVYSRYVRSAAGSVRKMYFWHDANEIMRDVNRKEARGKEANTFSYLKQYRDSLMRNTLKVDHAIGSMRAFAYLYYLGLNFKSTVLQGTQNFILGIPLMGKAIAAIDGKYTWKAFKDSHAYILQAGKDIMLGKLSDEENKGLDSAKEDGDIAAHNIKFITGEMDRTIRGSFTQVSDWLGRPFAYMEEMNRKVAYVAMYRMLKAKNPNMSSQELHDKAVEFSYDVHFPYGKYNLQEPLRQAGALSAAGRLFMTFRTFPVMYASTLWDEGVRQKNLHVLITSLAWVSIFGGAAAIPLLDDILDLMEKWLGIPVRDKMRANLKKIGGEPLSRFVEFGTPTLLPGSPSISGSMKIGVPFRRMLEPSGSVSAGSYLDDVIGVYSGLSRNAVTGLKNLKQGQIVEAMESLSPIYAGGAVFKAIRESRTGVTTEQGRPVMDITGKQIQPTGLETGLSSLSFQTARKAEASRSNLAMKNTTEYYRRRRDSIYEHYRKAESPEDMKAVSEEARKFNEDAAKSGLIGTGVVAPITPQSVISMLGRKPNFTKYAMRMYSGT